MVESVSFFLQPQRALADDEYQLRLVTSLTTPRGADRALWPLKQS